MSKYSKLAARATAAAMIAAAVSPMLFTGTAAADAPTSTFGGSVWFDRDSDGVADAGEPGRQGAVVKASGAGGEFFANTDANGKFTFQKIPFGAYDVTHSDNGFAATTAATVKITLNAATTAESVDFGVRGASICGTSWNDANGDGKHQADEPRIGDNFLGLHNETTGKDSYENTNADGTYCFQDIQAGTYHVGANDRLLMSPQQGWTKEGGDSKFSFVNGRSATLTLTPGQKIENFDAGYQVGKMDVRATQLLLIWGGTTYDLKDPNTSLSIQVGDEFTIVGGVVPEGNVAEQLRADLTLPEGLKIVDKFGGMSSHIYGQKVSGYFTERRHPGLVEFVGAKVKVEKAFATGEIKLEGLKSIYGETNLTNNVITVPFHAIEAEGHPSTTTAPATTTTTAGVVQANMPQAKVTKVAATGELAQTGANPMPILGLGAGLLAAGGGALWFTRRKAAARD
ncbi:SdrD B-like domain-containing protein [Actinokineospora sp. HUAS TT18]|uniref:SdrD B-like domain-containing protein n=1 Tax=Actinokineospora sp. HUAS TT18 TaxID=3447451 RepID=UPI003F527C06